MRKFFSISLAAACLSSCFVATPVLADPYPQTLPVTCTSTGQSCNKFAPVSGPFGKEWLNLTAPTSHCSPVKYTVSFIGLSKYPGFPPPVFSTYTTGILAPGQTTQVLTDSRASAARIYAEG